eukprot:6161485-Amphidinium_carterae.1
MATGMELFAFGRAIAIEYGIDHFLLVAASNETEGRILASLPTVHLKDDPVIGRGPAPKHARNGITSQGLRSLCASEMAPTEILSTTDPQQFRPELVEGLQNVLSLRGLYQEAMWGSYSKLFRLSGDGPFHHNLDPKADLVVQFVCPEVAGHILPRSAYAKALSSLPVVHGHLRLLVVTSTETLSRCGD